jgi:tRNA(Ile)-lysidine synthase
MSELQLATLQFIRDHDLLHEGETVLAALSGGPDSVALALILLELAGAGDLPLNLHLAHLNHQLRGAEADREEEFCRRFADEHGLELHAERADVSAAAQRLQMSIEAAARKVRYEFLGRTAHAIGAQAVATGHHADDVAETLLMRIVRGAGVRGLAAMAPSRPLSRRRPNIRLVRPLLPARKADLLAFLNARGQAFCEDSSNRQAEFTRNKVRNVLMPMLERDYASFSVDSLYRLNQSALEVRRMIGGLLDGLWPRLCKRADQREVLLDAATFAEAPSPLRKAAAARALRLLAGDPPKALRAQHLNDLAALPERQVGTEVSLPGGLFARPTPASIASTRWN